VTDDRQPAASRSRGRFGRGLRFRVVVLFAVGGLLLSSILAIGTYGLASRYLVSQRERSAQRQAYLNARALRDSLQSPEAVPAALSSLELPTGSSVVIRRAGKWFGTSVAFGRTNVPAELRGLVGTGKAGHQRVHRTTGPAIVVGIPIPSIGVQYFEVIALTELESTLDVIRDSLLGTAALTTVAAALLGVWAGRRVLSPLRDVSAAASDIADGEMSRRLETRGDPDLDPLVLSFNHMVDELQRRMDRDAQFASDVSHELRSPLTTMLTSAEILEARTGELTPRLREPVMLLGAEVRRFERLVSELLELSRAESAVEGVELEPVNLGELVLHSVALTSDADFVVEIDPHLATDPVLTDKRRVNRILTNLLENARTHGGGITAVTVAMVNGRARIMVDDSGDGVSPDERERIFERFFRGAAAGRRDAGSGTGLGLALVAEHTRLLRGRVWVEDTDPGPGARFVVELPEDWA
jgi:two-component system, OmpR family, sensor histidine kinase MtrB